MINSNKNVVLKYCSNAHALAHADSYILCKRIHTPYNVHSHTIRHIELIQQNGRKSTMDMRLFYNLRTKKNKFPLILCVTVSFWRWEKIASTQMVLHSNFKNSFTISYFCFSTSLIYCVPICFPFAYYVIFCVYQCSMCLANVICYPFPLYLLHSFFV